MLRLSEILGFGQLGILGGISLKRCIKSEKPQTHPQPEMPKSLTGG